MLGFEPVNMVNMFLQHVSYKEHVNYYILLPNDCLIFLQKWLCGMITLKAESKVANNGILLSVVNLWIFDKRASLRTPFSRLLHGFGVCYILPVMSSTLFYTHLLSAASLASMFSCWQCTLWTLAKILVRSSCRILLSSGRALETWKTEITVSTCVYSI